MDSNDKTRIVTIGAQDQRGDDDIDKTLSTDEFEKLQPSMHTALAAAGANIGSPDITLFFPPEGPQPQHVVKAPSSSPSAITKTVIKGRFELDTLLGVGGMGTVYKALDRRKIEAGDSKPYVAIKLLNDDFRNHPDAFISLQSEARKCQTLAHPNIVNVFDFDREGELVYMTMEFLEGSPLDKLLLTNPLGLPHDEAFTILKEISHALSHAHSYGIVHSDFKPGNIFITKEKGAKVFDFGIARAATEGSAKHALGDKTLFDPSNLSALTPAYASYEMLKGKEPSTQDDVYALACVAYQLFGGVHPFNRTPADKAYKEKLKPQRLRQLSRRQWRALEAALEFTRDKRTPTVDQFIHDFFGKPVWLWVGSVVATLSVSVAALAFSVYNSDSSVQAEKIKKVVTQELQEEHLAQRAADKKDEIDRVIGLATLSRGWERNIRTMLNEFIEISPEETGYRDVVEKQVSHLFLEGAKRQLSKNRLDLAENLLARANDWYERPQATTEIGQDIDQIRQILETAKLKAERQAEEEQQQKEAAEARKAALAFDNKIKAANLQLQQQLECDFQMDIIDGVAGALQRLARLDQTRARQSRPAAARTLRNCMHKLSKTDPFKAELLLRQAQSILPGEEIITNTQLDYCRHLTPGSGGNGDRHTCRDRLNNGSWGPTMVSVKTSVGKASAIGKYEVTFGELEPFCRVTKKCKNILLGKTNMPATSIPISLARDYLGWLSFQTGNEYRLPNVQEWLIAANGKDEREASDRNCYVKYAGIERGYAMFEAQQGSQNTFGLVNHVGNAQEWALDNAGNIFALGGHHEDPMNRCLATTKRPHNGKSDSLTGFRIARDIN